MSDAIENDADDGLNLQPINHGATGDELIEVCLFSIILVGFALYLAILCRL
jgi:hypothetical protein